MEILHNAMTRAHLNTILGREAVRNKGIQCYARLEEAIFMLAERFFHNGEEGEQSGNDFLLSMHAYLLG